MAVARVADAMDYFASEQLLLDNLKAQRPVHMFRTLDEYYFSTPPNSQTRGHNQVTYRGTSHTRVLTVNQLWLWILDDSKAPMQIIISCSQRQDTIITSFPRRWGRKVSAIALVEEVLLTGSSLTHQMYTEASGNVLTICSASSPFII